MDDKILKSATLRKGYGLVADLEKEMTHDDILHLQLGGYIHNGISDKGETFCLTKRGKDMFYYNSSKVTWKHRIQGWFLQHALGFNVVL